MLYNRFMASLILATKLYIPSPPPKAIVRPRLIERLNEGLSMGRKLTLISAPAGFGKSTVVSEWIAGSGRPVAWLSLDEGDGDPARFLTYLIRALQNISSDLGMGLLDAFQSPQPPIESILTAILNEIAAVPDDFILVLDDYHEVDSKPVDDALTFFIEHLPPQMHLVITTREDPALPLPRLRARAKLTEIRAADLRFTPSEATDFLNRAMDLDLSVAEIAALETRTEGWIAGLQLSALSMQGQKDSAGFINSLTGTHRFVLDYLIEEVLQQQPQKIQDFLLCTSILNRMCGPLCDAVLPDSSGQENLEYIERANLFVFPLDNERHWYRYHPLFADLLRHRLGQDKAPEEIAQYHICASEWYEKKGDKAEAFRHLMAAKEFNRAAGLAETSWQAMHESFQSSAWLGWVKGLPEELIRSRPVLCTQIAWAFMDAHDVDASESRLRDAERGLEGPPDGIVIVDQEQFRSLQARIAFARAYNAQSRRDFLAAIRYAELALELIPVENQSLRAQATAILGATYLVNGDLDAACQSMDDWIASSMKAGNYFYAFAYAMAEKADIQMALGHLREALRTYQQSLELAAKHDSGVQRVMAHHYLGMAMLYYEMGADEAADQHFQKSVGLSGVHMSVDWSYRRCIAQARIKESVGELEAALELLEEAKRFYIKTLIPHTRPIDAIKARIYLKQGRFSKAQKWVNEQGLSVDDDLIYVHEFEHIILARVLLAEYENNRDEHIIPKALNLLERLLKAAEEGKRISSMVRILMIQARVYHVRGTSSRAFESLERALTLAQPEGYFRIFVDEGKPLRALLLDFRRSMEKKPRATNYELSEYVEKLLAASDTPSTAPVLPIEKQRSITPGTHRPGWSAPGSAGVENPIEPLSQRELDILRLFRTELSGPEIARELVIAVSTVRSHTKSIYSKLGVNNRRAAVKRAAELNLI
jgi:LuxR family transcriptional regulator, maltose regulon positive regulatory protein